MKKGFTLAEVLITLGIIGIVTAMTIPILIQNVEEHKYKSAWKKEYSTLSNVFNQIYADEGDNYSVAQYPDYTYMKYYFCKVQNRLKVSKSKMDCTDETNPILNASSGLDTWGESTPHRSWSLKDGTDMTNTGNGEYDKYLMQLNDGALIKFDCISAFWVDVNGYQKPNIVGKDIFYFFKGRGSTKTAFWGNVNGCNAPNNKNITASNYASDCETGTGWGCSAKYILNND